MVILLQILECLQRPQHLILTGQQTILPNQVLGLEDQDIPRNINHLKTALQNLHQGNPDQNQRDPILPQQDIAQDQYIQGQGPHQIPDHPQIDFCLNPRGLV